MRKMFVLRVSIPKNMLRFGLVGVQQWILGKGTYEEAGKRTSRASNATNMWLLSVTSILHQNNPVATWKYCYLLASSFISLQDVTRYMTCHKIKWDVRNTYWRENIELRLPGRKQKKTTRLQLLFLTDVYLNKFVLQVSWRGRQRLKCDGTRAETRFRLSAKRTSQFKSAVGVSSVDYWQPSCAHQRY